MTICCFSKATAATRWAPQWLQHALGPRYRVHLLRGIYSYMHLDSTISLLRPGLALLNPRRLNAGNLPAFFDGWRILWCPDPIDIGFYAPYEHASQWVGMNLLMLDEQTAIVEQTQVPLIRMLESRRASRWCPSQSAMRARSAARSIASRSISSVTDGRIAGAHPC